MKIEYLGHSCFKLTESTGTGIITDPYGNIGYELPEKLQADAVTVSHAHHDHSNVKAVTGRPRIFREEGTYELDGVELNAIKSFHDGKRGRARGENLIFKFRMDGLDIVHLGDIGEECTAELIDLLLPVDILLIPVGGKYTIDAEQAKEYVDRIMPGIVIPMHYKTKDSKVDVGKPDEFLSLFDEDEIISEGESSIELFRDDIDGSGTKVVLLERKKSDD
ncbi:MAG: MBL fold metallo-hydrolase [Christensenellaceae bacterium]